MRLGREGMPLYLLIAGFVVGIVALNTALQLLAIKRELREASYLSASSNFTQASYSIMSDVQLAMAPVLALTEASSLQISARKLSSLAGAKDRYLRSSLQALYSRKNILAVNYGFADGTFFSVSSMATEQVRRQFHAPNEASYAIWAVAPNDKGFMREWWVFLDSSFREILTRDVAVSYDPRTKDWYRYAIDTDKLIVTRPYIFTNSGQLGVACAKASPNGEAVFSINVTLNNINDTLRQVPISAKGILLLLDDERRILAATAPQLAADAANGKLVPLEAAHLPGGELILQHLEAAKASGNASATVPTPEGKWFFRYTSVPLATRHLSLLMLAPLSDYAGFAGAIFWKTVLLSLFVLLFSVAVAFWLAQLVARPIRQLMYETERIAASSQEEGATVLSSIYEVHSLAESINQMEQLIAKRTQSLQKMTSHLEALVEERTSELEEARKSAEAANKAKSSFLASMSHEIRTPMNAIIGFSQLFSTDNLTDRQRDYLGKIRISSEMLLAIINDVLDLSKIEAGKLTLEKINFHLRAVIDSIRSIITTSAEKKGLSVRVSIDPAIPDFVTGDPSRLQQILLNLVSNAVKFTHHGEVALIVELDSDVKPVPGVVALRIRVSDTGIGISPESLANLFKPFTQADQSITRKFGGTGLGLVICKQLLALMRGSIDVESVEGEGTTFTCRVSLALPKDGEVNTRPESLSESKTAQLLQEHADAHVLIVEDNEMNQEIVLYMLELCGLKASVVDNGRAALDFMGKNRADIVLMDMQMPEMDGLEATRRLRQMRDQSGALRYPPSVLPIIAMTANAMAEDMAACLKAGMNDHISKPLNAGKLYACLAHWLARRQHGES